MLIQPARPILHVTRLHLGSGPIPLSCDGVLAFSRNYHDQPVKGPLAKLRPHRLRRCGERARVPAF
jgi:hypothetical protein